MFYAVRKYPNRVAAVTVWLVALATTVSFIREFELPLFVALLWAGVLQLLLTYLQHFVWAGSPGSVSSLGYIALLLDGFINFGGAWPIISRLHVTSSYQGAAESLGLSSGSIPALLSFILAVALSILLCAAPEKLWSMTQPTGVNPPKGYKMNKPTDYFAIPDPNKAVIDALEEIQKHPGLYKQGRMQQRG